MPQEFIRSVSIDRNGCIRIKPEQSTFAMIYRAAAGIQWDHHQRELVSQTPIEWSHFEWYAHIVTLIKTDCSIILVPSDQTHFVNVSYELQKKIAHYKP